MAIAFAAAGCDSDRPDIDPFPIAMDTSAGPVFLRASLDGAEPIPAIIDTLTPKTAWVENGESSGRFYADRLTLWNRPPGGDPSVPRARFWGVTIFGIDPCAGEGRCRAGVGDDAPAFEAIIGSDVLSDVAVTFDFDAGELRLSPDVLLGNLAHAARCKAIFRNPFAGGGTLVIGGAEESFAGRRPTIGACMDYESASMETQRGTNALFVLSTGVGPTILGESAYARYRTREQAPALGELPAAELHLPGGSVRARMGEVQSLALASDESDDRGPCKEIYTHRAMRLDACRENELDPCPCPEGEQTCRSGAVVDLGGPVEVAVLPDDHELLQSLRNELRPAFSDVDGILGARALADLRVELDYPNRRMLFTCAPGGDCGTYPPVRQGEAYNVIDHCPIPE